MIILPGVTYYFKSDVFRELKIPEFKAGDSILVMMLKEDKNIGEMYPDDFFKIDVSVLEESEMRRKSVDIGELM